jgi:hypothetical protein
MKLSSATIRRSRLRVLLAGAWESSQNRCTWLGTGTRAYRCLSSAMRRSFSARQKPRFGMNGNGWAGSMASGVSTGNIRVRKISSARSRSGPTMSLASSSLRPSPHSSARTLAPDPLLLGHQLGGRGVDPRQLLARRQPVLADHPHALAHLALQAGHADHVEFVEVVGADRQEPQPLQQRVARIGALLQHPLVEGQPRGLAVEEPLRRAQQLVVQPQARQVRRGRRGRGGQVEGCGVVRHGGTLGLPCRRVNEGGDRSKTLAQRLTPCPTCRLRRLSAARGRRTLRIARHASPPRLFPLWGKTTAKRSVGGKCSPPQSSSSSASPKSSTARARALFTSRPCSMDASSRAATAANAAGAERGNLAIR